MEARARNRAGGQLGAITVNCVDQKPYLQLFIRFCTAKIENAFSYMQPTRTSATVPRVVIFWCTVTSPEDWHGIEVNFHPWISCCQLRCISTLLLPAPALELTLLWTLSFLLHKLCSCFILYPHRCRHKVNDSFFSTMKFQGPKCSGARIQEAVLKVCFHESGADVVSVQYHTLLIIIICLQKL